MTPPHTLSIIMDPPSAEPNTSRCAFILPIYLFGNSSLLLNKLTAPTTYGRGRGTHHTAAVENPQNRDKKPQEGGVVHDPTLFVVENESERRNSNWSGESTACRDTRAHRARGRGGRRAGGAERERDRPRGTATRVWGPFLTHGAHARLSSTRTRGHDHARTHDTQTQHTRDGVTPAR